SAHPSVIARHGAASKYKPEGFKHKNYAENKLTDGRVYIVVDPHEDQDMAFLRDFVLDVYPRAEVIRFPYAGHQVLFHVNRTGQLKRIIQDIVADAPEIQADPDLHSEYSDAGRARHYFAAGDYENAKFYAERALARAADAKPIESALRALLRDIETLNASLEDR